MLTDDSLLLYLLDPAPTGDKISGPYPIVVEQTSGRKVLVVQAGSYLKYLGCINVQFDDAGEVVSWSGMPLFLDHSIAQGTSSDR